MDVKSTLARFDLTHLINHGSTEIERKGAQLRIAHTNHNLVFSPDPRTNWMVVDEEIPALTTNPEVKFSLQAIHNREREVLPANKMYRPTAGWEMDWFG